MDPSSLIEVDSLMSWVKQGTLKVGGKWEDVGVSQPATPQSRAEAKKEIHMESVCCGALGLSILLVSCLLRF